MKRLIFVICALFVLSACTSSQVNTNVSIDEKAPVLFGNLIYRVVLKIGSLIYRVGELREK